MATRHDGTKIYYRLAGHDVAALYVALRDVAGARNAQATAAHNAYLGVEGTETVYRDELQRRLAVGEVIAVDMRPSEEYAAGHIPARLVL
ncbi:hypothetical protein [Micromonospora sp. KC723]|uniref:hypothetical protein n=1 Tax=Micromonospora sp. KC723 TaxID=2530381 RepID=UPI001045E8AE|nr:hypothetical protein [Micromonospora sp. KC723]TDB78348.1 hypothetical protein E1165_01455 [Micromonospora sp. KC723]